MKIEHIALYVNDLEAARGFFMKYLGAKSNECYHNPKTNFQSYFLSFDDGARLEIMNKSEMSDLPKELSRTGSGKRLRQREKGIRQAHQGIPGSGIPLCRYVRRHKGHGASGI